MFRYLKKILNKTKLRVRGSDNVVNISDDVYLNKKSKIKIHGIRNEVNIGNGIYSDIVIDIDGDDNIVNIVGTNRINNVKIVIQNKFNSVTIGRNSGLNTSLIVACGKNNEISIGDDCMISTNVEIWGCDGHSILQNNKIINYSRPIRIGNHVWIGANSKILKGSVINCGCVIGANSLVTGKHFNENLLVAGNPAKVIKNDISWTVENLES